jgi:hypothetical protein
MSGRRFLAHLLRNHVDASRAIGAPRPKAAKTRVDQRQSVVALNQEGVCHTHRNDLDAFNDSFTSFGGTPATKSSSTQVCLAGTIAAVSPGRAKLMAQMLRCDHVRFWRLSAVAYGRHHVRDRGIAEPRAGIAEAVKMTKVAP